MKKKKVKIKKSDLKEGFRFNRRKPEYRNQRTAEFPIWKDKEKASLNYHERGNFYPPDGPNPIASVLPRAFIKENVRYPIRNDIIGELKKQTEYERGTEEFQKELKEWVEEAKKVFWGEAQFKDEVVLERRGEQEDIKFDVDIKGKNKKKLDKEV